MFKIIIILILITFSQAKEQITLKLDWLHQFQFAGYYMAKEKGFYKEYDIEVQIDEYNFGTDQISDVLDQKNTYAVGKSSLIIDTLSGKELIILSAIFQHSPMVLVTTNPNIKKPNDLYNKNIMLTPDARTTVAINSMISSQGVNLKDINFQEHSFNLQDLIDGKTDAMGSYLSNEPYILEQKNIQYNILDPREFGFDFYGGILFTSKRELKNNPTRVQNFNLATLKGWDYAFNNIEETVDFIYKNYNTQNKSLEALTYEANTLKKLSEIDKGFLGKVDINKLKEMVKIYSLLGHSLDIQKINTIMINQNSVLLSENEKNYLKNKKFKFLASSNPIEKIEKYYLNLITEKIGLNYEIIYAKNSKNKEKLIKNREIDFKISIDLNNKIRINDTNSKIIENYDIVVATLNDYKNFIYDFSLLNNEKIAINTNSINLDKIKKLFPKINFIETNSTKEALIKLTKREVIAVFDSILNIKNSINNNTFNNIKVSGKSELKTYYYFQSNKDEKQLISILNKTIDKLDKNKLLDIKQKNITLNYITKVDNSLFYKIAIPLSLIIIFIIIVNLRLKKEIKKNKIAQEKLQKLAEIDTLTQSYNRRKITTTITDQIKISNRYKRPLSIVFLDIDNFKYVNDEYGHQAGDLVLKEFTSVIKNNIRDVDSFGRWGGEEFIILLPETPKSTLDNILNKIQEAIESFEFTNVKIVTCSFGATTLIEGEDDNSFINRADKAMYHIKKTGKNGYSIA